MQVLNKHTDTSWLTYYEYALSSNLQDNESSDLTSYSNQTSAFSDN